jgi:hypothetical protein
MSGCWLWTGSRNHGGYGVIGRPQSCPPRLAHRIAYELLRETIPANLDLDHLCRVPCCVNPAHLEAVTRSENIRRNNRDRWRLYREAQVTWRRGWLARRTAWHAARDGG